MSERVLTEIRGNNALIPEIIKSQINDLGTEIERANVNLEKGAV